MEISQRQKAMPATTRPANIRNGRRITIGAPARKKLERSRAIVFRLRFPAPPSLKTPRDAEDCSSVDDRTVAAIRRMAWMGDAKPSCASGAPAQTRSGRSPAGGRKEAETHAVRASDPPWSRARAHATVQAMISIRNDSTKRLFSVTSSNNPQAKAPIAFSFVPDFFHCAEEGGAIVGAHAILHRHQQPDPGCSPPSERRSARANASKASGSSPAPGSAASSATSREWRSRMPAAAM